MESEVAWGCASAPPLPPLAAARHAPHDLSPRDGTAADQPALLPNFALCVAATVVYFSAR